MISIDKLSLSHEHIDCILGYVLGYYMIIDELDISKEELDDLLLDHNIEQCRNCEHYTESFNLLWEDENDGYCDNCRKYDKEEV